VSVLYFVTPAWLRYELSDACAAERRWVMDMLNAESDLEVHSVVVADDENLDIAREYGFEIVEQNNDYLGRKFNDGIEYAATHGADWIVPIGSDSWIDPMYFMEPLDPAKIRTSELYTAVAVDKLAQCRVRDGKGAGPYVIHRDLLGPVNFRPCGETLHRSIDRSMIRALGGIEAVEWEHKDLHPLQYIGFRGEPTITSYDILMNTWGLLEVTEPWEWLPHFYPQHLVDKAQHALREIINPL
jgi:hypothetical protein